MARNRYDRLMSRQLEISLANNRRYIGDIHHVLVEAAAGENVFSGRTFFQAPEVDGLTYIHAEQLPTGTFIPVKVTDALEYDLVGDVV